MIGRGGSATVYAGRQQALERDVAVKVVWDLDGPLAESFLAEARVVGALDHPNVVRVHAAGRTDAGQPCIVMERVEGATLRAWLDEGRLFDEVTVVTLAIGVLRGLEAANTRGYLHGDVKPSNVLLDESVQPPRAVLVDFGLASALASDEPTLGGTLAYMAPEQLFGGQTGVRSDLYSVGLVVLELLTGWSRQSATQEPDVKTLMAGRNPVLAQVLADVLSTDPGGRPLDAATLRGQLAAVLAERTGGWRRPSLLPVTEHAPAALAGRAEVVETLQALVESGPVTLVVGGSGMGKTSLLRAGLLVGLRSAGVTASYASLNEHAASVEGLRGTAVLLDQLEIPLASGATWLASALDELFARVPHVVVAVREEYLAHLLQVLGSTDAPLYRLGPMPVDAAAGAVVTSLAAEGVDATDAVGARVAAELEVFARDQAREHGWPTLGVYPPHLRLAVAALASEVGEGVLGVAGLERIGGVEQVLASHLKAVLRASFGAGRARLARGVFSELATASGVRRSRPEAHLVELLGDEVVAVLEELGAHGLVRPSRVDGAVHWSVVHDALVKAVGAWQDADSLSRMRAHELLLLYVEQADAIIGRRHLAEIDDNPDVVEAVDHERNSEEASALVQRSRRWHRRVRVGSAAAGVGLAVLAALGGATWVHEGRLRAGDVGELTLDVVVDGPSGARPFTGDVRLFGVDREGAVQLEVPREHTVRRPRPGRIVLEASAGEGVLRLARDGCPPSWVRVHDAPGYAQRGSAVITSLRIPSCAVSMAHQIEVPAGPFVSQGPGEPPLSVVEDRVAERTLDLPAFAMDRFEVSNARYAAYAQMSGLHGREMPTYPANLDGIEPPDRPVVAVDWQEARDFCRYHGGDLPTSEQWEKALRGGLTVDGEPNPWPRRNLPWGVTPSPERGNFLGAEDGYVRAAPVTAFPTDAGPYGHEQLAGNASEWTRNRPDGDGLDRMRVVRGGHCSLEAANEDHFAAFENMRDARFVVFHLGFRCVSEQGESR